MYAYVHRTREKDSMVAFLWDYTKLYLASKDKPPPREDIDHVSLYNDLPEMHYELLDKSIKLRQTIVDAEKARRRKEIEEPLPANATSLAEAQQEEEQSLIDLLTPTFTKVQ